MESVLENGADDILQRHKKERKELQSKIQSLKKTATKGDKKKKKEVQEEIAKLELELERKHEEELSQFKPTEVTHGDVNVEEQIQNISLSSSDSAPKLTKAQKRREKKAAEQKEREKRILEQEKENETGQRNIEIQKIKENLKKKLLMIYEVPADGNCLYNAVDHQLSLKEGFQLGVEKLRAQTSKHLRENKLEYIHFLNDPVSDNILNDEQYEEYCENVANTTNWGGQVELRVLTHVVEHPIEVIQADAPPLIMGEEYKANLLTLTYHRYMYKLGEHYNSVQPLKEDEEFS